MQKWSLVIVNSHGKFKEKVSHCAQLTFPKVNEGNTGLIVISIYKHRVSGSGKFGEQCHHLGNPV